MCLISTGQTVIKTDTHFIFNKFADALLKHVFVWFTLRLFHPHTAIYYPCKFLLVAANFILKKSSLLESKYNFYL